ncbi:unnamed protein product [Schistosoma curassoni]|uniref:Ovule protein n=1 Tax=Schistosoma curassoni TaxID=6186 RepID=A0A183JUC9_9TREM|nr:unnamed protein product [Schistosoma curassoni]
MMLPKYVKVLTSSKSCPSIVTGLVHAVLYWRILFFPLCMLRPTVAEAAATLVHISTLSLNSIISMLRTSINSQHSSPIIIHSQDFRILLVRASHQNPTNLPRHQSQISPYSPLIWRSMKII